MSVICIVGSIVVLVLFAAMIFVLMALLKIVAAIAYVASGVFPELFDDPSTRDTPK